MILRKKKTSRRHYRQLPGPRHTERRPDLFAINLFAFTFLAIAFLILGRIESSNMAVLRNVMTEFLSPVMETASVPAGYINRTINRLSNLSEIMEESERLRAENARLKQYKWRAEKLELELAELVKLKNAPKLLKDAHYLTGRLILDERSPFSKSFLVNIGTSHAVQDGMAVVNADGLIGRTMNTGKSLSRILLLTDPLSHIPVVVGPDKIHAILSGNRENPPLLTHKATGKTIKKGAIVYTSGEGNTFPPGIRIGTVMATGKTKDSPIRIHLDARNITTDFVRIMLKGQGMEMENILNSRQYRREDTKSKVASHPPPK